jgi:ribosomal-protein-alanine N-acetyltransferase
MKAPDYFFEPMDEEDAPEIAARHYEAPYEFHDVANDPDDLAELLDPERRQGHYAMLSE